MEILRCFIVLHKLSSLVQIYRISFYHYNFVVMFKNIRADSFLFSGLVNMLFELSYLMIIKKCEYNIGIKTYSNTYSETLIRVLVNDNTGSN